MRKQFFNSLAPGRPRCHLKNAIFNLILLIGIFILSKDNALRWMPRDLTDDKSTLVQVMAWCRQATSHYLSQWWPSSMSPYGVTRPQWVDLCCKIVCLNYLKYGRLYLHNMTTTISNKMITYCYSSTFVNEKAVLYIVLQNCQLKILLAPLWFSLILAFFEDVSDVFTR